MEYTDGGNVILSRPIQGNVFIGSGQTILIDGGGSISGAMYSGNVAGTAQLANALSTASRIDR